MAQTCNLHASAAALNNAAVLILGASGSGKSTLLIELLACGFTLIGDDQLELEKRGSEVWAVPLERASRRFEARNIGIFQAHTVTSAPIKIVVDMDAAPQSRLPACESVNQFGVNISKIAGKGASNLSNLLYLMMLNEISLLNLD